MRYGLVKIGAAPAALSLSDQAIADYVRAYLPDEASAMSALRKQAEEEVTRVTGRAVLNQAFRMDLEAWPLIAKPHCKEYLRSIPLPRTPLVSIESVKFFDSEGALQTVDTEDYLAVSSYEPSILYLKKGFSFPCVADRPDAIQIEFTSGYGTQTVNTPDNLRQAMLLLCRHFYAGGSPDPSTSNDYDAAQTILMGQRVEGFVA